MSVPEWAHCGMAPNQIMHTMDKAPDLPVEGHQRLRELRLLHWVDPGRDDAVPPGARAAHAGCAAARRVSDIIRREQQFKEDYPHRVAHAELLKRRDHGAER